ncbi:MAG: EamA family transporter, partial [Rhodoferax sp.]|nr:EamA family transporter [Rhodoferax sp.]
LAYASFTLVSKHLVGITSAEMATFAVFTTAALIALPVAALTAGPLTVTNGTWLMVSYLGIFATGIAFLLFSHALRHVAAATCVTLSLAEPLTAFVLAIVVVGERPGGIALGGLALVAAGLLLVVWFETRGNG